MGENGTLLRDEVHERWVRFFDMLLSAKSLRLDPTIIEMFPPRPLKSIAWRRTIRGRDDRSNQAHVELESRRARRPPGRITKP